MKPGAKHTNRVDQTSNTFVSFQRLPKYGHKLLGITTNCLTLIDTFCMATAGASHLTKFHRIGANERSKVII